MPDSPAVSDYELGMWTIYDHPSDYPDHFVARLWLLDKMSDKVIKADTLEDLRDRMRSIGLCCLSRDSKDDPKIVETWI